jgi:protein-S-isoprenylcysteine O-methyltransferase Ste14
MWDFEEDLRWCANLALGCAFVLMFGGVILSSYMTDGKDYTLIMFGIMALLFAGVGIGLHYRRWREFKRRTIIRRPEDLP